jgi:predicted metal-dependent hydrolase
MSNRNLHKKDAGIFSALQEWAFLYAEIFNLPIKSVRALEKKKCARYFGRCSKKGNIRIRVRESGVDGEWKGRDEAYQIIDTLSHELAHLWEQSHNDDWFSLHTAILERMSLDGIYVRLRKITEKNNT